MSPDQLREHLDKYHGGAGKGDSDAYLRTRHQNAHHFARANHRHRSPRISEAEHAGWSRG